MLQYEHGREYEEYKEHESVVLAGVKRA